MGAYGLPKDPTLAERYLRIAAEGGDVGARRNLGLLLLEAEGRVEEAMHALGEAAQAGDAQAAMLVRQLGQESKVQEEEARSRLEKLAAGGDARAVAMVRLLLLLLLLLLPLLNPLPSSAARGAQPRPVITR